MNRNPKCCVPSCSNTWELTKDRITYYRFPTNEKVKQQWLNAIRWYSGNPDCNDYVCADHFDVNDLSTINENTNIIPTIFNPEFVAFKTESELLNSSIVTINNEAFLDIKMIRTENDEIVDGDFIRYKVIELPNISDNEIETETNIKTEISYNDSELECYQIIETPEVSDSEMAGSVSSNSIQNENIYLCKNHTAETNILDASDSETEFLVSKNMEIENSSLCEKPLDGANANHQSINEEVSKITKVDLSKVRFKVVTDGISKAAVKTVPVMVSLQLDYSDYSSYSSFVHLLYLSAIY